MQTISLQLQYCSFAFCPHFRFYSLNAVVLFNIILNMILLQIGSDGIPRKGGKPHPRLFGTFPRVIGRFALKEQLIPLEEAVRRMTSLTAHRFQLYDRGLIIPGLSADLVLFNEHFIDVADYESPERYPNGLEAVWVNGKLVLDHKQLLNDQLLPGIVIKTII